VSVLSGSFFGERILVQPGCNDRSWNTNTEMWCWNIVDRACGYRLELEAEQVVGDTKQHPPNRVCTIMHAAGNSCEGQPTNPAGTRSTPGGHFVKQVGAQATRPSSFWSRWPRSGPSLMVCRAIN